MDIDKKVYSEGEGPGKSIMVILVGAPGSGKSTFCEDVIRSSSRTWARICQDTIGNGRSGTRSQCLSAAASAMKDGKNILIDRCNMDREQRKEFMKLGEPELEKHAVVFDLPSQLCISRSVKRTRHEGDLQGGKAAVVVNRMIQNKELPKLNEGFSHITFCQNETDVRDAVNTYANLGPLDSLLPGIHGQIPTGNKIQLGIMKFLKKTDMMSATASTLSEFGRPDHGNPSGVSDASSSDASDPPTLAFPSVSTSGFQFDLEKAADVIVEKVEEFVDRIHHARLVLVDLSPNSKILSLVRAKAAVKHIDRRRFFTLVGDITRLYTRGGLCCTVIANAANWRLKPGGGGVNAAIFAAAGPALSSATMDYAESLFPGKSMTVPLPWTSPLFAQEGVTHVIHVLGPNMNPKRPNCLHNDYEKGRRILSDAYSSLFANFARLVESGEGFPGHKPDPSWTLSAAVASRDRPEGEQKTKRAQIDPPDRVGKDPGTHSGHENRDEMAKSWGSWAQVFRRIAVSPEKYQNDVLEVSADFFVINDLYPKAKRHLLVVSRAEGLDRLADVGTEHLHVLNAMHSSGVNWAEKFINEDPSLVFRLGYHSEPSMRQLHLHVISQDYGSEHMKKRKHWNSFNSAFFRDSVDVIREVADGGRAAVNDGDRLLSMELRCNRCRSVHPNLPRLKSHLRLCRLPFPAALFWDGVLLGRKLSEPL